MNWVNVLKLCGEGGSVTLQGRKNENDTWSFKRFTNESTMADLLSEEDAEGLEFKSESKVVEGLDNAIKMLSDSYPYWANLHPTELYPELADSIIQHALSQRRCRKDIWVKLLSQTNSISNPGTTVEKFKWTTIIELGAEGGSLTLYGHKNKNAMWCFKLSTDETTLMEEDDSVEDFKSESKVVEGWGNAIDLLNEMYPYWKRLYPLEIHPDFSTALIDAGLNCAGDLDRNSDNKNHNSESFSDCTGRITIKPKILIPTKSGSDWQHLLANPILGWRKGYSAMTTAACWEASRGDLPVEVRSTLSAGKADLSGLKVLAVIPEWKVELPPEGGRPSQTDVMVLASNEKGLVAIGVEAKVKETFGPTLADKRKEPSKGIRCRLDYLHQILGLTEPMNDEIRYQLLHRTVSALLTAQEFHASSAVMLVHSFSRNDSGRSDFNLFCEAIGATKLSPNLYEIPRFTSPRLYLAWCAGDTKFLDVELPSKVTK